MAVKLHGYQNSKISSFRVLERTKTLPIPSVRPLRTTIRDRIPPFDGTRRVLVHFQLSSFARRVFGFDSYSDVGHEGLRAFGLKAYMS